MIYQSLADLGGREGYGPVIPEPEGERFHADWERQALALTLAMGATGAWNLDMTRSARETLPDYRSLTYYEIWIKALESLLLEHGLVRPEELAAARRLHPARSDLPVLRAADVPGVLSRGSPTVRQAAAPALFALGDRVRLRADRAPHHTRLPGYARGKIGRIERVHGAHVFADAHAHGLGEHPQWLYTVVFSGCELWGGDATHSLSVSIDAWEPYLEALS
ncbi:MAG TPA: nitrile hydratase subunit beta [Steroidobacteraceae bacterium]|nr:nitrile hydratase subunit beta [Steroidobacteraceae bacterium]